MKLFKGLCALALVAALAYPAYAEVQTVKVGGDITTRGFFKSNFDLKKDQTGNVANGTSDDAAFWSSFTHVGVNADLTDNVSAEVGISNQRLWAFSPATASEAGDIDLFSSYVTLKEFLYSPLTLTVGLQPLKFGSGFIVGPGLLADPSGGISSGSTADGNAKGTLATNGLGFQGAREYSILNYFNAIRGTLDYNPWTIDAVYAAISETVKSNLDQTLWGVNVGYKFGSYNADAELYWFYKDDQAYNLTIHPGPNETQGRNFEVNQVHTIGLRGDVEPITSLKFSAEAALQTGKIRDTDDDSGPPGIYTRQIRSRRGFATDLSGEYAFDMAYSPTLGAGWVYFSGEEAARDATLNGGNTNGKFGAWDPMYRGKFYSAIQDFLGGYQAANLYGTNDPDDTAAGANRHLLRVFGGIKPLDSLKLNLSWVHVWFAKAPLAGRSTNAGDEIDAKLSYDYTDDVKLNLLGAWFLPGNYYDGQKDASKKSSDTATEIAGTVSVVF